MPSGHVGWFALVCALTCLASWAITSAVRRAALRRGLFDVPNERSSHQQPTPRSGGLGMVFAMLAALALLAALGWLDPALCTAFAGGGVLVAAVGFADDRLQVPAGLRLAVHFAAAAWVLYWLGGAPLLQIGDRLVDLGFAGNLLTALGIVWVLNLFNFMDGIDGIAASEGVTVSWAAAALGLFALEKVAPNYLAALLGAAALGFLVWNWSPARIFMGDVGSGFLGFAIAMLAVSEARAWPPALWSWSILCAVFIADATVTLVTRLARGERPHVAHRSHAYQQLALRFGHRRVTQGVIAVNLLYLLPIAWLVTRYPASSLWLAGLAFLPLVIAAIVIGAGRSRQE